MDKKKRPGFKFAEYELKGVPIRVGIGKRDLEKGVIEIARRDTKEKFSIPVDGAVEYIENLLTEIQQNLFQKAVDYRTEHTTVVDDFEAFKDAIENKGGFVSAHWDGTEETEKKIKELTKATIRCIPNDAVEEDGLCIYSQKPSKRRVLFAKAY
jgi:prolyl-tRNA synthetase